MRCRSERRRSDTGRTATDVDGARVPPSPKSYGRAPDVTVRAPMCTLSVDERRDIPSTMTRIACFGVLLCIACQGTVEPAAVETPDGGSCMPATSCGSGQNCGSVPDGCGGSVS